MHICLCVILRQTIVAIRWAVSSRLDRLAKPRQAAAMFASSDWGIAAIFLTVQVPHIYCGCTLSIWMTPNLSKQLLIFIREHKVKMEYNTLPGFEGFEGEGIYRIVNHVSLKTLTMASLGHLRKLCYSYGNPWLDRVLLRSYSGRIRYDGSQLWEIIRLSGLNWRYVIRNPASNILLTASGDRSLNLVQWARADNSPRGLARGNSNGLRGESTRRTHPWSSNMAPQYLHQSFVPWPQSPVSLVSAIHRQCIFWQLATASPILDILGRSSFYQMIAKDVR